MGQALADILPHRVAVTGLGAICGLGHDLASIWPAMLEGRSGISPLQNVAIEGLPNAFGGEVKNFNISDDLIPEREAPRFDQFVHFALHATDQALRQAGARDQLPYDPTRCGCILGVGIGGFPIIEKTAKTFFERGLRRVSPFFIPGVIPNMASGMTSLRFKLLGMNYTVSSACASAGHALQNAAYEIMMGRHDLVVTGGAEATLDGLGVVGFQVMKALSRRSEEPQKASRPFDRDRDGFVMGEGSGVLVLENFDKAKARGATILAEVVGMGASSDAHHITAPHPEGSGAIVCMRQALASAKLPPEAIHYINAHGTSTPLGDQAETAAIKEAFGSHAHHLKISSTKSMTGHLLGAAGGLESVVCVQALQTGMIPPTINLDQPGEGCDLDYTPHQAVEAQPEYALNNSFGFGGTNSSLIFKRY